MKGKNKMKETKKVTDELKNEIKQLKKERTKFLEESKIFYVYKKLILTAAKSQYEYKDVVEGLKFAAKLIVKKDWDMVEKIGGASGDLMARGVCPTCDINLVGENPKPRSFTLPCSIKGCTFNIEETNMKGIR
jgi:hypothetical protein